VGASFYDGCLKPNCSRPSSFSFRAAFLFSAAGAGAALTTCHALSQLPESLFSSTEQKIRSQNGNSCRKKIKDVVYLCLLNLY